VRGELAVRNRPLTWYVDDGDGRAASSYAGRLMRLLAAAHVRDSPCPQRRLGGSEAERAGVLVPGDPDLGGRRMSSRYANWSWALGQVARDTWSSYTARYMEWNDQTPLNSCACTSCVIRLHRYSMLEGLLKFVCAHCPGKIIGQPAVHQQCLPLLASFVWSWRPLALPQK
jgi:hypothetical protein